MNRALTRRDALRLAGAAAIAPTLPPFAWAAGKTGLHGLSIFGDLKYPAGFTRFDFVNANAPKSGRMVFQPPYWNYNQSTQTFNTLNAFVLKGDAPPRIELIFDTLMSASPEEPDSVYGLVAETVDVSDDLNLYTFHLRDGPRFHDSSPLTAEDVAFSLMLLKEKGHPNISQVIREMVSATAPDLKTVIVTLSGKQTRETILTIVGLPIFSKASYGAREFDKATLDPPLGSGAYKVGKMSAGRFIEYDRVPDYWGKDLAVNGGYNNFDVIRVDFYTERQAAFEAFKKGEITFREEFTSITWAKDYDFPALTAGRVKQSLFPSELRPSLQGSFINTRRAKFRDPRTRLALNLAFDFEWSNRNLFFDSYTRLASYFEKSIYKAEGLPTDGELAILGPLKADLSPEVFGEAYVPPKSDGSGRDRKLLGEASRLLQEAGWRLEGNSVVDEEGAPFEIEFLIDAAIFERVFSPYIENLRRIGIDAAIRQVDPTQYEKRLNEFDFDIVSAAWSWTATPLDRLQQFFGSDAAETPGTNNYSGIKDKAIDALIARLSGVQSRDELITLIKAIDRVLRAQHFWIPSWYQASHRVAHWDLFGWPEKKPDYAFTPETTWWFDAEKATATGKPNG